VFLLVGLSIFRLKTQKNIPLISLNFITLTTYFVPLFLVSVWYRSQDRYDLSDIARNALTVKYEHYLSLAEYGGYILLLIAMYFLFSGLYKKWIALPEE
jgi:hypothetical protein